MRHEEVIVQYHGIHTSDLTKNSIKALIDEIHEEGPTTATVRAMFTKRAKENDYRGIVHVHSKAGSFFTAATHSNLMEVAEKVLEQMRRQMDKWKSNRIYRATVKRAKKLNRQDKEQGPSLA
jgi:ribosome-associated translation inhibitor RaiA